jgi:hypothetical protein
MSTPLDTRPDDVATKAETLLCTGRFSEAAYEFRRAAALYAYDRDPGAAAQMVEAAITAQRAYEVQPL